MKEEEKVSSSCGRGLGGQRVLLPACLRAGQPWEALARVVARAHGEGRGPVQRNRHLCHAGCDGGFSSGRFGHFAVATGPSSDPKGGKQLKKNVNEEFHKTPNRM